MIAIGGSLGAFKALQVVLRDLPPGFALPVAIVVHRHRDSDDALRDALQKHCALPVVEVLDKEPMHGGHVYLGPADYHLLAEAGHFSLCTDEPVNYARPSIDVLFESAADVFGARAIGVVLTGASRDGARGAARIRQRGGTVVVQDPAGAESAVLPAAVLAATGTPHVRPLEQITALLIELAGRTQARNP